jgi:hypothetical protein
MELSKLIIILKIISCLSLGTILTLTIVRNSRGIFHTLGNIRGMADGFTQKQVMGFERQSRYIYRKKAGRLHHINVKLARAGMIGYLNSVSIIILSILIFLMSFFAIAGFIKNTIMAFYISTMFAILPYMLISIITQINLASTEKHMLYNMETLLNFISIDRGNIRNAYKSALKYFKPNIFKKHTEIFVFHIFQRNFADAVDTYKSIVNIKVYGDFLDIVTVCDRIGGDYEKLVSHFTERLAILQKAKISRMSRSASVRIAIYFLIFANIGFFFLLKAASPLGYELITNNPFIMSFVFISMYIVLYLGNKAGKLKI